MSDNKNKSTALQKINEYTLHDAKGKWKIYENEKSVYSDFSSAIAKIPRLTEEEEQELGVKIQKYSDNTSKKKLVLHNMRLAIKIAHQYKQSWTNIMDLVQEASAGMAIAAEKWDPSVGVRFGTYAAYWMKAQLTKFLMTNSRLIHTGNTRAGRKIWQSLPKVTKKLALEGKVASPENVATELDENVEEVARVMQRLEAKEASLSAATDSSKGGTLADTIESLDLNPEEEVAQTQMQKTMKKLFAEFEAKIDSERDMSIWKYHLISSEPTSLVDLGKKYGVSKQRMGQLAIKIKRAFKRHIVESLGPNTHISWLFKDE